MFLICSRVPKTRKCTPANWASLFGMENSAMNSGTLGGGMAERRTRRRLTRQDKAQAVKRLPALNLILQLGERDLAHAREANGLSGGLREVDDPAVSVRTPVIDPHHHGAAGALVGNPHPRAKRQGLMCRRERVVVELFAVGRVPSMKAGAVARSDAVLERLGLSRATECKGAYNKTQNRKGFHNELP